MPLGNTGVQCEAKEEESLAPSQHLLHPLLHILHLLRPFLTQAFLVIPDDGSVAHEGDQTDAEEVGEAGAQALHYLPVALGMGHVDLQDGSAEELGLPHDAVVKCVQVLVPHIVGIALLKVILSTLLVLGPRLHYLHELAELVADVLLHAAVLAVQRLLLDLQQGAAVLLGDLVQASVHAAELALQCLNLFVIYLVENHFYQRAGHTEYRVHHGSSRRDRSHTLQDFHQPSLQLVSVLQDLEFSHGKQLLPQSNESLKGETRVTLHTLH